MTTDPTTLHRPEISGTKPPCPCQRLTPRDGPGAPLYVELILTATDSGGLIDNETLQLDPQTVKKRLIQPYEAAAGRW